jgi:hypothetical protein
MRRRYRGHKSYGLGKLTKAFNIELKNHHRLSATPAPRLTFLT